MRLSDLTRNKQPAPAPLPATEAQGKPGATAISPSVSPADANASRYNEAPVGIYEACRQFGIMVPLDRSAMLEQIKACLVTVFQKILLPSPEKYMIWPMIKSIASDIGELTASNTIILNVLHRGPMDKDNELAWHCVYTAILATGIARSEDVLSCSLVEIAGAALIHDMGFLFLRNGYDHMENEMNPESTGHVARGVELARVLDVPDAVSKMIALHHGRLDGKGFPKSMQSSTFDRTCQILAIANICELAVYHLFVGEHEEETEKTGENTIGKILKEYRQAFDIDLLKKMISLVGFYPVGSVVELNNRSICKVIKQNINFPLRPVVQVVMDGTGMHPEQDKMIDLKEVRILSIIRTLASPGIENVE